MNNGSPRRRSGCQATRSPGRAGSRSPVSSSSPHRPSNELRDPSPSPSTSSASSASRLRGRGGLVSPPSSGRRPISASRGRMSRGTPRILFPEPVMTAPNDEKTGRGGSAVNLLTNYFKLNTPRDDVIYDYHITFEPNVEAIRARRQLVYQHRERFNGLYIFDGGSNVKSLHEIKETLSVTGLHNDQSITLTIKPTGRITWGHPEMIRFYNTQMKRNLYLIGMIQIGQNQFDRSHSVNMPIHRIEVWPGFLTAINEHDFGIMMVANSLNKIIRKETVLHILKGLYEQSRQDFRTRAQRELAGLIVMTNYNSKTYRIDDIIFDKNPISYEFEKQGRTMNLKDYYYEQYQQVIEDEKQPLLVVRPSDKQQRGGMRKVITLVPEFCLCTGATEMMKRDNAFRRELDRHIKLDPERRIKALHAFNTKLTENDSVRTEMAAWNLSLDKELVQVTGRLLPPEKILTNERSLENGILYDQRTGSFEVNIRNERMRSPTNLEYWVIVAHLRYRTQIESYQDSLRRVAGPLGIRLGQPRCLWIDSDQITAYLDAFRTIPADKVRLTHVIVPNSNRDRYNTIKRFFSVTCPCASQVLTLRVLERTQLSIVTKLVVQMSVKMGAQAWALHIPPKKTMVVGYNTYRDTSRKSHSVGAFVCSTNTEVTSWFSRVHYHASCEEMSTNFSTCLKAGLLAWRKANNGFPERIVIYRDGVSEGQIGYIFENEVKNITELLKERTELSSTTWCFIIVNKRVNSRFFMKSDSHKKVMNPYPGTVIDSGVTRVNRYDFYLISQSVRLGTVNPTLYNIVKDITKWKPEHHQTLAYKLCHLYYNWAGTISVPAPCHYAYKLAFLIGTCIHQEPSQALNNSLWFL